MSQGEPEVNLFGPRALKALNRLCKWRAIFAGWQLGTRLRGDPEGDAVRDHREATIFSRAELSAITGLLIAKGVFSIEEFNDQLADEAEYLDKLYEKKFPGIRATDDGIELYDTTLASKTMEGWKP